MENEATGGRGLGRDARSLFSLAALVVTSVVPLVGVVFLKWEIYPLMLLFWAENVIVGVFNALSMLAAQPASPLQWLGKLFLIPFFSFHYGMFTMVHGVFVLALFGNGLKGSAAFPTPAVFWREFGRLDLLTAVLAVAAGHLASFVFDYLATGDFRRAEPGKLMMRPYGRIMILHITLLLGGFLTQLLHSPLGALLVLVALKLALDLRLFWKDNATRPESAAR